MHTRSESMGHKCSRDLHRPEKAVARECHPEHSHGHRHHHYPFTSDLETAFTAFPEVAFVRGIPNGRSVSDSPGAPTTCATYISIPALPQPVSFAWLPLSVSNKKTSRVYIATPNKALNPSQEKRRKLTLLNRELCFSQHLDNRRANHRARLCLPPKYGLPIQNYCRLQKH